MIKKYIVVVVWFSIIGVREQGWINWQRERKRERTTESSKIEKPFCAVRPQLHEITLKFYDNSIYDTENIKENLKM